MEIMKKSEQIEFWQFYRMVVAKGRRKREPKD
jgi:hypothetical protein